MLSVRSTWVMTVVSCLCCAFVPLLILLHLASGYSAYFIGLFIPPNSEDLRRVVALSTLASFVIAVIAGAIASMRGVGVARKIAILPTGLCLLSFLYLVNGAALE